MALEHAILVSLAERSASGYDLTRRFDKSIGHFWTASHQQIYKVLGRMETAGLVASTAVPQDGRPDKKVYAITGDGREALRDWSREPSPTESARSDFAVKLRGLPYGDRDAILADVGRRAETHRERLAYYRADEARTFPDVDALDETQRAQYAVLRGGILLEEAGLAWCEEIAGLLGGLDTPLAQGLAATRPTETCGYSTDGKCGYSTDGNPDYSTNGSSSDGTGGYAGRRRRERSALSATSRTPIAIVTAATISTACTHRKPVGVLSPTAPSHARSSFQIASPKRGQITMLNTPASTRNHAARREITRPVDTRGPHV